MTADDAGLCVGDLVQAISFDVFFVSGRVKCSGEDVNWFSLREPIPAGAGLVLGYYTWRAGRPGERSCYVVLINNERYVLDEDQLQLQAPEVT